MLYIARQQHVSQYRPKSPGHDTTPVGTRLTKAEIAWVAAAAQAAGVPVGTWIRNVILERAAPSNAETIRRAAALPASVLEHNYAMETPMGRVRYDAWGGQVNITSGGFHDDDDEKGE
jgi:hypothetical protein